MIKNYGTLEQQRELQKQFPGNVGPPMDTIAGQFLPGGNAPTEQPGILGFLQKAGRAVKNQTQQPGFYDRLALGLNSMRLEPDQALAASLRDRMSDRRELARTTGSRNQTVALLRNMGGEDPYAAELADAVETGGLSASAALTTYYQTKSAGQSLQQIKNYPVASDMYTVKTTKMGETKILKNNIELTEEAEIQAAMAAISQYEIDQQSLIAGGKTDAQKRAERRVTVETNHRTAVALEAQSIGIVQRMLNDRIGMREALGAVKGRISSTNPAFATLSGPAKNFVMNHEQLMGTVFTSVFESLKGGGSITENETAQAKLAAARFNKQLDEKDYRDALEEYITKLSRAVSAHEEEMQGQPPTRSDILLNFEFPAEL